MLVCQNVSPAQGRNYYLDDISFDDAPEQKSSWHGRGAKFLGLSHSVEPETFQSLLSGKFTDGTRFRKLPSQPSYKQRGAIDCILAAPKSVSLLALVNRDLQLLQAHTKAVERVLDLIEERYIATRVRTQGQRITINTQNLVVAKFPHSTSRELDPHLHTHCVILNMTKTPNGRWLSLKNDTIFQHQKFLGQIYQNELALNIQQLGYQVEFNRHGQMELKNCARLLVEVASKRHLQIQGSLNHDSAWHQEKLAWATTRKPKQNFSLTDLQDRWHREFAVTSPERTLSTPEVNSAIAPEIVHQSLLLAQQWHKDSWSKESVEENILTLAPGQFSWSQIKDAVPQPNVNQSSTVLTIETAINWQDLQRKINQLTPQQQRQTLTVVAERSSTTTDKALEPGIPWLANPPALKVNKIVPFQRIFVLNQASDPKINQNVQECLRRLKRTFKSRVNNSICDWSNYSPPQKEQIFQGSPEYYQDWYSNLKTQLATNSDKAIARHLHQQHIPLSEMRKVLARSDYIHNLAQSYPDAIYRQKAVDYVQSIESSLTPTPSLQRKIKKTLNKSHRGLEL